MPGRVATPETTSRAQGIRLVDVCKNFGPVAAVISVSISVQPGEFLNPETPESETIVFSCCFPRTRRRGDVIGIRLFCSAAQGS